MELYLPPETTDSTGITNYEYNSDRQLTKTILSDSSEITVVYNTSSCGCSGGSKPLKVITDRGETTFKYSKTSGQLDEVVSPTLDTLKFAYDGSLPLSVEWAGAVNGRVDVNYNNDFKVTSQRVNGVFEVSYNYDNDGLLSQAGDLTISHNPVNGMMTGTSLGNITTSYNYNTYGELKQYVAQYGLSDVFHANYELDDIGRITGITETCLGKTNTFSYQYDLSGQLIQVQRNDTLTSEYFFDDNGNRISYIANNDTVHGVYDDQDRMLAYDDVVYAYNAQGSLTTKITGSNSPYQDTTRYTYDLMGNLLAVALPDGDKIEYLIDAQNRRIGKIFNDVIIKKWIYKDQLNPIAELDGNDNLLARFVYGSKAHVPDYIVKGDTTYRVITDHLGSVRAVVNVVTGEIVQEISYNEFGNVLYNSNPAWQPFAYAGGLHDIQTGLVRFGARDYDCFIGRWTTKDPGGFNSGMLNLFNYTNNNPICYFDKTGFWYSDAIRKGHNSLTWNALNAMGGLGTPRDFDIIMNGQLVLDTRYLHDDEYHYHTGSENQSQKLINDFFNAAVEAECAGNHSLAMYLLGKSLHITQDRWAHSMTENKEGNTRPVPDEDNVNVYAEEYLGAYYDSIFLLMKFQTAVASLRSN